MRCEEYLPMLNELLNKTLTPGERRGVEAHLAVCEGCRNEFQRLKRADELLREAVSDMFSEIEVPADLSSRIEEVIKKERKKTARLAHARWLPAFLKVPAVAAALLLFVAAGTFGYRYIFAPPLKQSQVVLQEPVTDNESKPFMSPDGSDLPAESSKSGETYGSGDVQKESAPVEPQDTPPAPKPGEPRKPVSGNEAEINLAREGAPPGKGGDSEPGPVTERRAGGGAAVQRNAGQPADSAQSADSTGPVPTGTQEDLSLFAAGAPGANVEDGEIQASEKDGFARDAQQDAAKEVGFVCLEPAYLPRGAELQDVTWRSGTVYQNYRVGQLSLQISQTLAKAPMAEIGSASKDSSALEINGVKGILEEKKPGDADGTSRGYTTITWQQGELLITVGGELPREELVKIASSLK